MVIFHCYVSLPEGIQYRLSDQYYWGDTVGGSQQLDTGWLIIVVNDG